MERQENEGQAKKLTLKTHRFLNEEFNTTVNQAKPDKLKLEMGIKYSENAFKRERGNLNFEGIKQECWYWK